MMGVRPSIRESASSGLLWRELDEIAWAGELKTTLLDDHSGGVLSGLDALSESFTLLVGIEEATDKRVSSAFFPPFKHAKDAIKSDQMNRNEEEKAHKV